MPVFGHNQSVARKTLLSVLALLILCVAVYSNSLHKEFMSDDYGILLNFKKIHSFRFLPEAFSLSFESGKLHYWPIYHITNMFLYRLCGEDAVRYHIASIFFFFAYVSLVFVFLKTLLNNNEAALIASLLFLAHPINGIAVNYITSYILSLSGIFLLLSLLCFLRFLKEGKTHFYLWSTVFFIVGLLSYEQVALFPAYLFCILFFTTNKRLKEIFLILWPYLLISGGYAAFLSVRSMAAYNMSAIGLSLGSYLASFGQLTGWYVVKLISGRGVVPIWSIDPVKDDIFLCNSVLFILSAMAVYFLLKYRKSIFSFVIAWLLIGFLPLGLGMFVRPDFGLVIEPHWFFFSSIGYFLFLSLGICRLWQAIDKRVWSIFLLSIFLFYGLSTKEYNAHWRSPEAYDRYCFGVNPRNPMARFGVAYVAVRDNRFKEAVEHCQILKKIVTCRPTVNYLMGAMEGQKGNHTKAREYFLKAVGEIHNVQKETAADIYLKLAVTYIFEGRYEKAEEILIKASKDFPELPDIVINLARLYMFENKAYQAVVTVDDALKEYPRNKELLKLAEILLSKIKKTP